MYGRCTLPSADGFINGREKVSGPFTGAATRSAAPRVSTQRVDTKGPDTFSLPYLCPAESYEVLLQEEAVRVSCFAAVYSPDRCFFHRGPLLPSRPSFSGPLPLVDFTDNTGHLPLRILVAFQEDVLKDVKSVEDVLATHF